MTFAELKAKLDTLTPEQLAAPAIWWGDDRGGEIKKVDVLEEDYISVGEGMEPKSAYVDADFNVDSETVATMKAGTPVLISDE